MDNNSGNNDFTLFVTLRPQSDRSTTLNSLNELNNEHRSEELSFSHPGIRSSRRFLSLPSAWTEFVVSLAPKRWSECSCLSALNLSIVLLLMLTSSLKVSWVSVSLNLRRKIMILYWEKIIPKCHQMGNISTTWILLDYPRTGRKISAIPTYCKFKVIT